MNFYDLVQWILADEYPERTIKLLFILVLTGWSIRGLIRVNHTVINNKIPKKDG